MIGEWLIVLKPKKKFLNDIDYKIIPMNSNIIALHSSDQLNNHIKIKDNVLSLEDT